MEIVEVEGKDLVHLIESGKIEETYELLKAYLQPMVEMNADHIVLGCTHYPFLIPLIKKIIPSGITIVDSGIAVAKRIDQVLTELEIKAQPTRVGSHEFYTNGNLEVLQNFLARITRVNYTADSRTF